ncbi:MAG: SDR family oxidoreductase [Candidatus Saccharibacteria bacterium]|nr:SDR family oxidoreductase [Candidatus Saccharibacteria bacterium]
MNTYLVTGASRGIGLATTLILLENGHQVIGTYNGNSEKAAKLEKSNKNLQMVQLDLVEYSSVDKLVSNIKNRLDGIVNSAGIFEEVDFNSYKYDALELNFKVNAFSPLYLVSKLQGQLKDGSSIVNISSTDSKVGSTSGMGYAASKATVESLTRSLSLCLAQRDIRVNAIAPGWIGDGMQAPREVLEIAKSYNPLNKLGDYGDIANIIEFLLSEKSAYINGTVISADGGDESKSYVLDQESRIA